MKNKKYTKLNNILENVNEFANIDFEYTVLYYMLPSLLVFTAFTFLFYFLHPYTTGIFEDYKIGK